VALSINQISAAIAALQLACEKALSPNFLKKLSLEKGEPWQRWIQRLTEIMEQNLFPTTVSKDGSSPFVAFVWELQRCLPVEHRQSTHSYEALATAILRTPRYMSESTPTFRDT
jgi:hypothetical protein